METYLKFKGFYFQKPNKKEGPMIRKRIEKTEHEKFFFLKFENISGEKIDLMMEEKYFNKFLKSKEKIMEKNQWFFLRINFQRYKPKLSYKGGYRPFITYHKKINFPCFFEEEEPFIKTYEKNIENWKIKELKDGRNYKNEQKNSTYIVFGREEIEAFISMKRTDLEIKELKKPEKITMFELKKQEHHDKGGHTIVVKRTIQTNTNEIEALKEQLNKKERRTRMIYKKFREEEKKRKKIEKENNILKNKIKTIMKGKTLKEQEEILDSLTKEK